MVSRSSLVRRRFSSQLPGRSWCNLVSLLLAVAAVVACGSAAPGFGAEKRAVPNILLIVADDMGFSDAGCYGGDVATPNLDRLAAGGLRFTQFYSTARCWPSRTCILTGYYAQQVRMDPPKGRLPAWTRVLPHYLKPLGYRTYHSGKWHLTGAPKPVNDGGFDHSYCLDDHDRYFSPRHARLDDRALAPVPEGTDFYVTTAIADYGIGFLQEHKQKHAEQPFLLYLAFTSPHFPLQAIQEDIARYRDRYREGWDVMRQRRYQRMREMGIVDCPLSARDPQAAPNWNLAEERLQQRIDPGEAGRAVAWDELSAAQKDFQATKMAIHAAMIDRMDRQIGRVLDLLKAMGVFENTIVFFVSDNGASAEQIIRGDGHDPKAPPGSAKSYLCLGPGWSTAANTPLRMHKSWVHEGGIASPLVVHWPAGISDRGKLRHTAGHFIDFLPTLLELAGGKAPGDLNGATPPPLPGRSLVPALAKDIDIPRDFLYWHHMTNRAVRVGDWKLVSAGTRRDDGPWELYDLKSDRSEMHNLAEKHPDKVKQLAELWQKREEEFRRQAGPAGPDQDAERVRNGNFTAIGKDRLPEGWSLWKPFWDRAACRVRVVGKEGGQAGRDGQVGNLPHAKTAENLPPDARGVAVDSPHEPFAVGGLRQDLTGIEGGQAYAIVAICAAKDITSPSQSLLVRMEWTKAGKGLHPAGMLVRGPRLDDGKLKFNDILIAPKEADGARLSLEVKWPQGGAVVWERVGVTPAAPPAPRKAKVGTVYLRPRNSTPERNLQLFSNEIDAAGRLGLDIVCLPEAITSAGTQQNGPQSAEPIPGPSTERLGNAARKNRLWVVAGLYERDGDRVYNTAVLLDREGRLAGKYRKIHLPREEWQLGVTPGHEYPVFQTDFGTIAMEICYDIFFPETTAAFSLRGAEVIFVPIWGNTLPDAAGRAEGESIFRVRARDHGVFLVPSVYDGNSLVVDPLGRILASSKGAQGVFWHEIDLGQRECLDWIGHWRSIGPRDRMPASYGPLVEPHKSTGIHATSATAP